MTEMNLGVLSHHLKKNPLLATWFCICNWRSLSPRKRSVCNQFGYYGIPSDSQQTGSFPSVSYAGSGPPQGPSQKIISSPPPLRINEMGPKVQKKWVVGAKTGRKPPSTHFRTYFGTLAKTHFKPSFEGWNVFSERTLKQPWPTKKHVKG